MLAFWLLLPTGLLLALIVVCPAGRLICASFFNLPLTSSPPAEFAEFEDYALMVDDPIFAWFFHSECGIVNDVLRRFGMPGVIWFNSEHWAMAAICLTMAWKTSSFMALIILAGLQTIPRALCEAAGVDGAGHIRQFFEITPPLLRPSIAVALILRTITALQTFAIPFAMTRGKPGTSTVTLVMYIHQNTADFLDLGYGSALAVVMFVLSMGASAVYLRMIRRRG